MNERVRITFLRPASLFKILFTFSDLAVPLGKTKTYNNTALIQCRRVIRIRFAVARTASLEKILYLTTFPLLARQIFPVSEVIWR